MIKNLNYKASETEIIRPFDTADGFFNAVSIRIKQELDFNNDEKIYLSDDEELKLIELQFPSFYQNYFKDLNFTKDKLEVSIVFKDRSLKTNNIVYRDNLSFFDNKILNIFDRISYDINIAEFEISVILTEINKFNILNKKKFVFSKFKQSIDVPKQWMSPNFFNEQGLSKDAVWYVNWIGADFNKSLSELIVICLNEKFRLNLEKMTNNDVNTLFQCQMASSIMLDIIYPVIIKNRELEEQNSLALEQVKTFLFSKIDISEEELQNYIEKENFHSILASWCLNFQKLDKEIIGLA